MNLQQQNIQEKIAQQHAIQLYEGQELRSTYFKQRNQIILKLGAVTLGAAVLNLASYVIIDLLSKSSDSKMFGVAFVLALSVIVVAASLIYLLPQISAKRKAYTEAFKRKVIKQVIEFLYPQMHYQSHAVPNRLAK